MDDASLAELAAKLTDDAKKLIPHLSYDGELVYPLTYTAADAGVADKRARKAVRELHAAGLTDFGTLTREDDGAMCGSGYWLNRLGRSLRHHLLATPPKPEGE